MLTSKKLGTARKAVMPVGAVVILCIFLVTLAKRGGGNVGTNNLTLPPSLKIPNTSLALRAFVQENKKSRLKGEQDLVGEARLHLAFLDVTGNRNGVPLRKSFQLARKEFLKAENNYEGTGAMGANYGGIPDQAAYQAAVCLVAEGRKAAARTEFRQLMVTFPLSPLCKASFDRLRRLSGGTKDGGTIRRKDEELYQHCLNLKEKHIQFETSICGPKCAIKILSLMGIRSPNLKSVATECHRTSRGCSIEDLRRFLQSHGLTSFGLQLNSEDFRRMPLPAIECMNDHFVVILSRNIKSSIIYDPFDDSVRASPLPPLHDPNFQTSVITFKPQSLN